MRRTMRILGGASLLACSACHADGTASAGAAVDADTAARCLVMMTNLYTRDPNGDRAKSYYTAGMFFFGDMSVRHASKIELRQAIQQATAYLNRQPRNRTDGMQEECIDRATGKIALISSASDEPGQPGNMD